MNISNRIRAARRAAGLSQEEVARRAGLSLKGMGDIERGDIEDPHFSSLVKIAHALDVPVESLIKEEEPALAGNAGKAEASATGRPEVTAKQLREHPYPWMSAALAGLLSTWERQIERKENPAQSRTIVVAALDVQEAVILTAPEDREIWEALPEQEKAARKAVAEWLEDLALRGHAHYKESKDAQKAELEAIERRREAMRRRTAEIA